MAQYRKRPIVVEATQFFIDGANVPGVVYPRMLPEGRPDTSEDPYVVTIHGQRAYVDNGDWVITESDGEHHYPCKPDIFEASYEIVEGN